MSGIWSSLPRRKQNTRFTCHGENANEESNIPASQNDIFRVVDSLLLLLPS